LAWLGLVRSHACAQRGESVAGARSIAAERDRLRLAFGRQPMRADSPIAGPKALLLAGVAGAGILFAVWIKDGLLRLAIGGGRECRRGTALDWRVLGFTLRIITIDRIVFGLAPAWRANEG